MSRSVKQDYDKLRAAQAEGKVEVRKLGVTLAISDEAYFDFLGGEYTRKVASESRTPPTHTQMREYHQAKAAMETLRKLSEYVDWGDPESEPEVIEPTDHITIVYAETVEQWLERCRALYKERTNA